MRRFGCIYIVCVSILSFSILITSLNMIPIALLRSLDSIMLLLVSAPLFFKTLILATRL